MGLLSVKYVNFFFQVKNKKYKSRNYLLRREFCYFKTIVSFGQVGQIAWFLKQQQNKLKGVIIKGKLAV